MNLYSNTEDKLRLFFSMNKRNKYNGYPSISSTGRIQDGSVIASALGSIIPKGVQFTNIDILDINRRIEIGLAELQLIQGNKPLLQYVILKYAAGITDKKSGCIFKCTDRTCRNWKKEALEFLSKKI